METVGGKSEETGARGMPWKHVLWVIAAALVMAVLLNASELKQEAEQKPLGNERDFWVAVWTPFAAVSETLFLDQPREWADSALNREDAEEVFELPPAATPVADATPAPAAQLVRTPSVEQPLKLWVGGDSVVKIIGEAIVRQAGESGLFEATHEPQLQSGLTRPDFFDWPREIDRVSKFEPPYEVVVVMFGANDAQGIIETDGTVHQQAGSPGWQEEYRRRVAGVMDIMKAENRMVAWVGQPIMRSDELTAQMEMTNAIFKDEASKRPWVKYIDLWPLFVNAEGNYDAYVVDDDGETKLMRNPDGVHLVREGGEKAARFILAEVLKEAEDPRP